MAMNRSHQLLVTTLALGISLGLAPSAARAEAPGLKVFVDNPPTSPVPIRDVEKSLKETVQVMLQTGVSTSFSVPSAKRLIIEYVSFSCNAAGSDQLWAIGLSTVANGQYALHYFAPVKTAFLDNQTHFAGSQQTRLHADPSTNVHFFHFAGSTPSLSCALTFSGYYMPL